MQAVVYGEYWHTGNLQTLRSAHCHLRRAAITSALTASLVCMFVTSIFLLQGKGKGKSTIAVPMELLSLERGQKRRGLLIGDQQANLVRKAAQARCCSLGVCCGHLHSGATYRPPLCARPLQSLHEQGSRGSGDECMLHISGGTV